MKEYTVKPGLLDRQRRVILASEYIEFENKNLKSDLFTRLKKSDIIDFKRGVENIIWYEFPVGLEYSLSFLDKDKKTLDIKFRNYFGLRSNYGQFYSEMINAIWEYYFADIVNQDLDKIYDNQIIELNGVKIGLDAVEFADTHDSFNWKEVDYKEYFKYFAIHKADNSNIHRTFDFNKWNSERLSCLIRTLKKDRGN